MRYAIYSYRYVNEMSFVCYADTVDAAAKEIDRLATAEKSNRRWFSGDAKSFTFMPEGDER